MAKRRGPKPSGNAARRTVKRPRRPPKTRRPATSPPTPEPTPSQAPVRLREQMSARERLRLNMMRSIVTEPLLSTVQERPGESFDVIIELNELFEGGLDLARERAEKWKVPLTFTASYCFSRLTGHQILALAQEARELMASGKGKSPLYRIWEDSDVCTTLTSSLTTVKADAAQRAFDALGRDIVWAVLDSGIAGTHPHFSSTTHLFGTMSTLTVSRPLGHLDFTPDGLDAKGNPTRDRALVDRFGHGSHVAGIIAGAWESPDPAGQLVVGTETRNESTNDPVPALRPLVRISGVAPQCRLVSLKVIADVDRSDTVQQTAGQGKVSWLLRAIDRIQEWNQHGKRLLVHGVNLSLGYGFDARWFGCGQSPLCVEVNRLVKSGVSVVVSAGNSGYPSFLTEDGGSESRYHASSITDPGNADLAITVGSTHRDMPHLYGVSYFSSRGPTGDGRLKPDLLAPGERIWSCAAGAEALKYAGLGSPTAGTPPVLYLEQTGTSMAAPHVSGAIAAFLSVRREFIGQPERVKDVVLQSAVDLRRERYVQGAGLLDLMRMLQIV